MGLNEEQWLRYWHGAHRMQNEKFPWHIQGALVWCLLAEDTVVKVSSIKEAMWEDHPHLRYVLETIDEVLHNTVCFGASALALLDGESITDFKSIMGIREDGTSLFGEFMYVKTKEEFKGISVRKMLPNNTEAEHRAFLDAMQWTAERLGLSELLSGVHGTVMAISPDSTGTPQFEMKMGTKAIDTEVDKFREELDNIFGGGGE